MLPIIKPLSPEEREVIGATWARRAESEARATMQFKSLVGALRAHGATPTVVGLCERASRDEANHVGICQKLALEFGVEPQLEGIQSPRPTAPSELNIRDIILYEMVAACCVNETINASLLAQIYERTKWPSIRLAAHTLVGDEIWHSRMGWAHLGAEHSEREISWLSGQIVPMLERAGAREIMVTPSPIRDRPHLADYGEFDYTTRIRLFLEVVNTVILPGFESFGLDVQPARSWVAKLAQLQPVGQN